MKKAQAKEAKTKGTQVILDPEVFEDRLAGAILAGYCQKLKDQYGYKPDGVKLGDARTIIFWYKPEGARPSTRPSTATCTSGR